VRRYHAIEDQTDRLSMREGILDEANVAIPRGLSGDLAEGLEYIMLGERAQENER
jgi:hypothetical protein